jgi:hypothetical protein
MAGLLLIVLTVGLGTNGFLDEKFENGKEHSLFDAMYKSICLLALQNGDVPTSKNITLEIARWLGVLFFASALLTFIIRLSRETVVRFLVKKLSRKHVIVAGLGENGTRLIMELRKRKRTVIVIEPNRDHPAIRHLRDIGTLFLFGETDDPAMYHAANINHAAEVLALFQDELSLVRAITTIYGILHDQKSTTYQLSVRCVLRVLEPGLVEVIRQHQIKTHPTDRIDLQIFNTHEIAATTMVREAIANHKEGRVDRMVVLGLGHHHRLGELVILRAIKDRLIQYDGFVKTENKLYIHVYDSEAAAWCENFLSRYPFVIHVAEIETHENCWARKVGQCKFRDDYDAAFICIGDDAPSTSQAVMMRNEVMKNGQPIMVRVQHSKSGYGKLMSQPNSGWGENMHAVGLDDAIYDYDLAMKPELELQAIAIHHLYREKQRFDYIMAASDAERETIAKKSNNVAWNYLSDEDREQNRQQAMNYDGYLQLIKGDKQNRYIRVYSPVSYCKFEETLVRQLSRAELEVLEEEEHNRYLKSKIAQGYRYGDTRDDKVKISPYIVEFSKLTPQQKKFNRDLMENMAKVLALADYIIVPDTKS